MNTRVRHYWIGVASKEHVKAGVAGGFGQLCLGKAQHPERKLEHYITTIVGMEDEQKPA